MLRNYLTVAFRNLIRNKGFSIINIVGLAVSMAFSILIFLWVADEVSVDKFHANKDRLYRVLQTQFYENKVTCSDATTSLLAAALKEEMPEVERATMMTPELWTFKVNDKMAREQGSFGSEDLFLMFSFPLLSGDPTNCLSADNQIVISQKLASKYFGEKNPLGKAVRLDDKKDFFVSGVFDDIPKKSSLQFDFILPFKEHEKLPWAKDWGAIGDNVFILLKENADAKAVGSKLKHFLKTKLPDTKDELSLQACSEMYLHSNFVNGKPEGGRIEYVQLFTVVAFIILLVACINFMNLATAQSVKRSKEVGIRKVIGAARKLLIGQFMGEAILTAFISLLLSLLLAEISLPFFNILTQKSLHLNYREPTLLISLIGFALVTGIIAGSYPAFFLSSFSPVKILKGKSNSKPSAAGFRKLLVVFQFCLSIIFILGTIIVYRQMQFIQNKNLGLNRENLIYQIFEGELVKNLNSFKNELAQSPGVESVTYSNQPPLGIQFHSTWVEWPGKSGEVVFTFAGISYDYLKTMNIELLEGRDFSPEFLNDSLNVIINEEAVKQMGLVNPLGHEITTQREIKRTGKIIGIAKNFHMQSLHQPIAPLYLFLDTYPSWGFISVRTEPGKTREAIASMAKANRKFNPEIPFTYTFADVEFKKQYAAETLVKILSRCFSVLIIFISCLGLFGLAAFTAEQRTKEMGIRKILGASVSTIVKLLSGDFMKLILIAILIATPLSWYAMDQWLQGFAYRTEIQWWIFGIAGLVAVVIALVTVSSQAIKAAVSNPVESLRSE